MNISRIIRSTVTIILSLILLAIAITCFSGLKETATDVKLYIKIIYIVLLFVSIFFYAVLKKKLYKKVENTNLVYIYRYTYLAVIVFVINAAAATLQKTTFDANIAVQILVTFVNVILIKRIIFNISTSDMLSAAAAIIYIFIPKMIFSEMTTTSYLSYSLTIVLVGIFILFKIIDEVSQHRMKTKKYIYLTLLLTCNIIVGIFFNITSLIWVSIILIAIIAGKNIDSTHLSLGQKNIDKTKFIGVKRFIYKIERININKLIIVLLIISLITVPVEYLINGFNTFKYLEVNSIIKIIQNLVQESRTYYISIIFLIILFELIGSFLGRKVDIKTTIMKWTLLSSIVLVAISDSIVYRLYIFDTLLILIFILDISNIYYNRDEKIKLLKETN